jgi:hypothetical protein
MLPISIVANAQLPMPIVNWQHGQLATLPHWQRFYFAHFAKKTSTKTIPLSADWCYNHAQRLARIRSLP